MNSLRARLLLSYLVIIALTLLVIGAALVVLLGRNPLPEQLAYQRLNDIARASLRGLRVENNQLDLELAQVAADNDIRALRISPEQTVAFDSAGEYPIGSPIDLERTRNSPGGPQGGPQQSGGGPPNSAGQEGEFIDPNGQKWLYIGFGRQGQATNGHLIVLALPQPRFPTLEAFGDSLLRPLAQAGLIGVLLAIVFAVLISSSVTRPLRRTAAAANAIADGNYDQQAPEEGPREVRDLAQSFNEMVQQVQASQELQREFLANVSHELKTPLTSIQGFSQAILDGAADNPGRAARIIHDEAGRMRRMVDDLLDLARIESGQTKLRREYISLSELLTHVLENLSLRAAEQQVTLGHEISPLPRLTGDPDRLAQVFTNLVDNALTHTPAGGQISVLAAREDGGGVQISISDTGKGIPPEDLPHVFERFYQVDKSRKRSGQKGTGLGLTISKEITEAHGGKIWAESAEGQGTTFRVWLPLPRPHDETVSRIPMRR